MEEARIPVYLNDEQAKAALKNLTKEAEKWRKTMYEAMAGGDMKGMKDAERELKKVTNEANKLKREAFDVNKVLSNLSGASINDLKKAMSSLRREQAGLNRDSKEYQAIQGKIGAVKGEFDKINGKITTQKGLLGNIVNSAKSLLPAFSFVAIAAGAKKAFTQIVNSTDTLSTKWAMFMGGMNEATDEFFRTLATGNWDNFMVNMRNAIEVGREYERILDEIESRQRALSVAEADARMEMRTLEDTVRNVTLSNDERVAAAEKRIKLEEELAVKRAKIAKQEYDNEVMMAKQASKLSDEKLMQLVADLDSEKKIKAEAYIKLQDELKILEAKAAQGGASTGVLYPGMTTSSGYSASISNVKSQMANFENGVIEYAADLRMLGNVTDEQLNKMVAAYDKLKGAEVSALENTKRVRSAMYSIFDEENRAAVGGAKKTPFKIKQEKDDPISNFAVVQANAEAKILAEKKASEEEWTAFMKKQVEERMDASQEELEKDQQNLEVEKQLTEARQQLKGEYMNAIGQVAGALASMFKEGSAAQIAALAVEKSAAIAQIIFQTAIANAKAVAISPLTAGQPWVTINSVSAAASIAGIVATTVSQFKDKKNNNKPGFASGGYTSGDDNKPVGIVHANEFVVNAQAVRNPTIKPILDIINTAQKTNRVANIDLQGGRTGGGIQTDPALLAKFDQLAETISKMKIYTAIEDIKNGDKKFTEIQNTRGL